MFVIWIDKRSNPETPIKLTLTRISMDNPDFKMIVIVRRNYELRF